MRAPTPRLVALALCLVGAPASAQVFTNVQRSGSPRLNEPGGVSNSLLPSSPIGIRDCEGEVWRFTVNFSGSASGGAANTLQYYVGADESACAMANARAPVSAGTARCWPIRQTPSLTVTNPTTPLSYTVEIQSRYLVDPEGGNCRNPGTTQGNAATNYLTLLAFPPSDNNVVGTYSITYDVQPPDAPFDVTASSGEGAVNVGWSYSGSLTTTEAGTSAAPADLQGFWLLCDPPAGNATSVDGGDGGDASVDATVSLDAGDDEDEEDTCGESALSTLDPNDDTAFQRYRCSSLIAPNATEGRAEGLSNGRLYRVAVVAQDLAGNRSTLALSSRCVRPQPVTDFWELYRAQGGQGQPGFCSARPWARGGAAWAWIMVGAVAALAAWRRRR
ncbi:MAG: hypothetical protein R3A52_20355 [Polyangiales bacterium]